eukprot:SAG31_NODE_38082_length_299_cov_0.765000_1_plen_81_part_10
MLSLPAARGGSASKAATPWAWHGHGQILIKRTEVKVLSGQYRYGWYGRTAVLSTSTYVPWRRGCYRGGKVRTTKFSTCTGQ